MAEYIQRFVMPIQTDLLKPDINSPIGIAANSQTCNYNNVTKTIISGNITNSISDHLTCFLLISNQNPFSKHQMLKTGVIRSSRKFNLMTFEEDLKRINWNEGCILSEEI